VRSLLAARGRAEALSSRRSLRSVLTLPLTLPLAPPDGGATDVEPPEPEAPPDGGVVTADEPPPVEPLAAPLALPDGVVEPPLLWANVSATGAARSATPSRAISKDFIPHLLAQSSGARPVPVKGGSS
jgi:hypothetical protein